MNELLNVNQGLSNRFSEGLVFDNMEPEDCWRCLQPYLKKIEIAIDQTDTRVSSLKTISLFRELSCLSS